MFGVLPRPPVVARLRHKDRDSKTYSDLLDSVTLICDGPQEETEIVSAIWDDNTRAPDELLCDPDLGEVMVGVTTDDLNDAFAEDCAGGFRARPPRRTVAPIYRSR